MCIVHASLFLHSKVDTAPTVQGTGPIYGQRAASLSSPDQLHTMFKPLFYALWKCSFRNNFTPFSISQLYDLNKVSRPNKWTFFAAIMRNLLYYSIVVELLHTTLVTRLLKETPPFLSVDICSIWRATSEQKKNRQIFSPSSYCSRGTSRLFSPTPNQVNYEFLTCKKAQNL